MLNCNSVRLPWRHIKVLLPGIKPVSAACWKQTNQLIQPDPSYTTFFATNKNKGKAGSILRKNFFCNCNNLCNNFALPACHFISFKIPNLKVGVFLHDWRWVMSMSGSCQCHTNQVHKTCVTSVLLLASSICYSGLSKNIAHVWSPMSKLFRAV